MHLAPVLQLNVGQPLGQLRAVPVKLGPGMPAAFLIAYAADFDVDPYHEMFFLPTDTLKIAVWTVEGKCLWKRDLGRHVFPGMWFVPILPFDLDGDGRDEIYFVNNTDKDHPLSLSGRVFERLDAQTGETTGQWKWPMHAEQEVISHAYRYFLIGGHVNGEPTLITASGTYEAMLLCSHDSVMKERWRHQIAKDAPGARGSHMCPVVDMDGDGVDELLWGERLIELKSGTMLWCADEKTYNGHSDVNQPVWDEASGRWLVYTCREKAAEVSPRVVTFDANGKHVWGDVEQGHMDMGWVARLGDNFAKRAMSIRIGHKTLTPAGRTHFARDEFYWDVVTGKALTPPVSVYLTLPVDLDGDGYHELVRGGPGGDGAVFDRHGAQLGSVGGAVSLAQKFCDRPGEQLLVFKPDGAVEIWADLDAQDSPAALSRYEHPFYKTNSRIMSSGSNSAVLGGI